MYHICPLINHVLMHQLAHHYVADNVYVLHRQGDWNDHQRTRGCVAGT